MDDLLLPQVLHRISLYQDGSQTHQLSILAILSLSTNVSHEQHIIWSRSEPETYGISIHLRTIFLWLHYTISET